LSSVCGVSLLHAKKLNFRLMRVVLTPFIRRNLAYEMVLL